MFRGVFALLRRLFRDFNRGIVQFTRWVGHLFIRCLLGAWGWARTRSWSHLFQALPAVAAAIGIAVIGGLWFKLSANDIKTEYKKESDEALAKRDWGRVILCQDRLVQLDSKEDKSIYSYAVALEQLGRPDRAMQKMKQIAPDNQHGYGEAHLWVAQRYAMSPQSGHRQIAIEQCNLALEEAGELSQRGNYARHLLAGLYFRMGAELEAKKPEEARVYFQKSADQYKTIVETWGHMHLSYAQVLKALKQKQLSDFEVKQAIEYFSARVKNNSQDADARLSWADALSFRGDYEQAIELLLAAPTKTISDTYKHALAQTFLGWHLATAKDEPNDIAKQVNLIGAGLRYEADNPFLLDRLLSYLAREGKDFDLVSEQIFKFNAEGGTATTKFLMAMVAFRKNKFADAETYFDQALAREPEFPILCNNFAWMLAEKKYANEKEREEGLDKALKLVNVALKRNPSEPSFRDTRGTVYMHQRKWKEAADELDFVNSQFPEFRGRKNRHMRLSVIYDKLGLTDLSKAHAKLALE
jgi:tetratricopeptide (TPR) repeat protein